MQVLLTVVPVLPVIFVVTEWHLAEVMLFIDKVMIPFLATYAVQGADVVMLTIVSDEFN